MRYAIGGLMVVAGCFCPVITHVLADYYIPWVCGQNIRGLGALLTGALLTTVLLGSGMSLLVSSGDKEGW